MSRESYFLDYNVRNIMTNLLQAEDHVRNMVGSDNEKGHDSCIRKHFLIVSGEAGEGISHSITVKPEVTDTFRQIKFDADRLLKSMDGRPQSKLLEDIRVVRKVAERLDANYDTSKCKSCGFSFVTAKDLNTTGVKGLNVIDVDFKKKESVDMVHELITLNASQMVGRGLSDYVAPQLDAMLTPGADLPFRASTWFNIAGGLALQYFAYKKMSGTAKTFGLIAGSNMVSKVVEYALTYVAPVPVAGRATAVAVSRAVPTYSNASLVMVD